MSFRRDANPCWNINPTTFRWHNFWKDTRTRGMFPSVFFKAGNIQIAWMPKKSFSLHSWKFCKSIDNTFGKVEMFRLWQNIHDFCPAAPVRWMSGEWSGQCSNQPHPHWRWLEREGANRKKRAASYLCCFQFLGMNGTHVRRQAHKTRSESDKRIDFRKYHRRRGFANSILDESFLKFICYLIPLMRGNPQIY